MACYTQQEIAEACQCSQGEVAKNIPNGNIAEWNKMADILSNAAKSLEAAGAECILICTNTMHKVAPEVQSSVSIPLLHIADPTGHALVSNGIKKVGLLGTRFTMDQAFYRERIETNFGISVVVNSEKQQAEVHRIIYEELCHGLILDSSKAT